MPAQRAGIFLYLDMKSIKTLLLFFFLTILTQIGGIIYLLSKYLKINWINKKKYSTIVIFIPLYLIFTFIIIPHISPFFGRVQLPIWEKNNVKPLNFMTCLLNRNYIDKNLLLVTYDVSNKINILFPNTKIQYLDACFPFIDKFPLLPHWSHNDGKKIDIAFFYKDSKDSSYTDKCPSWIGYGVCEKPKENEINMPQICLQKGAFQYSIMQYLVPQNLKNKYLFDYVRTKKVAELYAENIKVSKIFIEPHLKSRLGLKSDKVRFHGCHAVRHDDHLHIQ